MSEHGGTHTRQMRASCLVLSSQAQDIDCRGYHAGIKAAGITSRIGCLSLRCQSVGVITMCRVPGSCCKSWQSLTQEPTDPEPFGMSLEILNTAREREFYSRSPQRILIGTGPRNFLRQIRNRSPISKAIHSRIMQYQEP